MLLLIRLNTISSVVTFPVLGAAVLSIERVITLILLTILKTTNKKADNVQCKTILDECYIRTIAEADGNAITFAGQ